MEPFQPPRPSGWRGLPEWMRGLVMLGGAIAILSVPFYYLFRNDRIALNERAASKALKDLASAQADFRGNDRDGNQIQDYWTGDVAGLYFLKNPTGVPIKIIDPAVAAADARPSNPEASPAVPYHGYYFVVMRFDETGTPYGQDTKGAGTNGAQSRNHSKFAFCAYPATFGVTGRHTFCVNEGNTLFKLDLAGKPMDAWPLNPPLPHYSREPD